MLLPTARTLFAKLSGYRGSSVLRRWPTPGTANLNGIHQSHAREYPEAALELFRERGFAEATMREIAARAGVASGLAYYYFESKDAIVLAYYQRAKDDLAELFEGAQTGGTLAARLQAIIETKFSYFKGPPVPRGADGACRGPASPLSPFAEPSARSANSISGSSIARSRRPRRRCRRTWRRTSRKILWFYQMGLVLFLIYDRSPDQRRSRELLEKSLKVVVMLLKLSNLPLLKPARRSVLNIINDFGELRMAGQA